MFWKDLWCEDRTLKDIFPTLFLLAIDKDGLCVKCLGGEWGVGLLKSLLFKTL